MQTPFVHLRAHTEFSVTDGVLRIGDLVRQAASDRQVALAITDLSNLFGAIKFYRAARKKGVQAILGADCFLELGGASSQQQAARPPRVLLLVQNRQGYLNLCELLSRAWQSNVVRGFACIKPEWLDGRSRLSEGLICLSGFVDGPLASVGQSESEARALQLAALFPGRLYIELQRVSGRGDEPHVRATAKLAAKLGLPVVATHPMQFLMAEEYEAHEARVCVADGDTLDNPRRVKRFHPDQHFKTQEQMCALFADIPTALANTVSIAERCSLALELDRPQLPNFPTPLLEDGTPKPIDAYFREEGFAGLGRRLAMLYPDAGIREQKTSEYEARLDFELQTIQKMGFAGYFLIVADFIAWAKSHGCPVGPGRGSGAGSLVAYALGITDIDPLAFGLLFERFLNPDRVSMPDFDIDFCQRNRERVIEYVRQKYGQESVSQIVTFGTMAAKAALRDVGRVLGMSYGLVDSVSKMVPGLPGKTYTLAPVPAQPDSSLIYVRQEVPELEIRERAEEDVASLLKLATQLEGVARNVGMHAGGVLIAPGKITDFCPVYQQPGSTSSVSQFDKDDVEAIGLVKFDFLGLATLTILERAKAFICQSALSPAGKAFSYEAIPLNDAKTYKLFAEGKTEAVFQFESSGMQRMLKDAKPTRLEDLIALNAMFRPGPLENIPSFCQRKNGKEKVEYPHPLLAPVLAETFGIIVYQEQVMQAAQVMGGYTLGGADLLRRAMGKKKPEEMARHRETFRKGAGEKGIDPADADDVFDLMEKFAGYGFNKSHAAAYSLLAYQTAFIKVHHTAEFFAANMTVESDNTDKLAVLIADAKNFGIAFKPPCVNRGSADFLPIDASTVVYGLAAIKGLGRQAIENIEQERAQGGPYKSLFDFVARLDARLVNKRSIEALVRAGAFDALHACRASTLASVPLAFKAAEQSAASAGQGGLFDFDDAPAVAMELERVAPWGFRERLGHEAAALGLVLSGHLFDEHATEIRRFIRCSLAQVQESKGATTVAGVVADVRIIPTRRGPLSVIKINDGAASLEIALQSQDVDQEQAGESGGQTKSGASPSLPKVGDLVFVTGRIAFDRFSGALRMSAGVLESLDEARLRYCHAITISCPSSALKDLWLALDALAARQDGGKDGEDRSQRQRHVLDINITAAGGAATEPAPSGALGRIRLMKSPIRSVDDLRALTVDANRPPTMIYEAREAYA